MKKSFLFLVLLQSLLIFAQAPQKMTYQSVVRNSSNALLVNQAVGVRISIVEGSLTGAAEYTETHTVTTNANGLFTLEAGGGTPTSGTFATINWGNGPHYIKSEIDVTGGANYSLSGTMELLSVPYALYATNGISPTQATAINTMQAQIDAQAATIINMQAQINSLLPILIPTVLIGTQAWTTKNLDVATYSDGTPIPQVTDPTTWANLTTGAWCYYNNDPVNGAAYGKLYNFYAVAGIWNEASKTDASQRKKLAPTGYHIPTDGEWTDLTDYLGGATIAGDKMKETGSAHWPSANVDATNSSGFTGLPGGYRSFDGNVFNVGDFGYWWSSSQAYLRSEVWLRNLYSYSGNVFITNFYKPSGFSVRCLRD